MLGCRGKRERGRARERKGEGKRESEREGGRGREGARVDQNRLKGGFIGLPVEKKVAIGPL